MVSSLSQSESQLGESNSPLPVRLRHIEEVDLFARYHSGRCGGDFFDGVALDSRVVFFLTDIAGRRPETHAIAADVQKTFRARTQDLFALPNANESEGIALLARDLNRALIEAAQGVRFAPAFLGCYNLTLNILTYHYAGNFLAVFQSTEEAHFVESCGIPLGLFTHSTYEPGVLAFDRHAKLLLVTKGGTEGRRGPTIIEDERVRILLESPAADSASICEAVLHAADDCADRPWSRVYDFLHSRHQRDRDDLTAVALVRRDG